MAQAGSGNMGEAAILAALVQRGFHVLVPFGEGQPYDLAVDLGTPGFLRVQCKTAWPHKGCMRFNPHSTDHGRGRLSYVGRADIFGVYFPPDQAVYLVPVDAVTSYSGRLRLEPTRNHQKKRIRFAADFEIDRWTVDSLRDVAGAGVGRDERALTVA